MRPMWSWQMALPVTCCSRLYEGVSIAMMQMFKEVFFKNWKNKLAASMLLKDIKEL